MLKHKPQSVTTNNKRWTVNKLSTDKELRRVVIKTLGDIEFELCLDSLIPGSNIFYFCSTFL